MSFLLGLPLFRGYVKFTGCKYVVKYLTTFQAQHPTCHQTRQEVNPRIGGDLVFECPKARARSLFEKLNSMF